MSLLNLNSCYPSPIRPLPGRPFPGQIGRDHNWNLPDQNVSDPLPWRCGPFGSQNGNGYALDFNKNGRYDRGRDGVLVFDTNRDGRYDQGDVSRTNDMMKAAAGNYDFNHDGCVSTQEKVQGAFLRADYAKLDRNGDGKLDTWEMEAGGGKVWIDKSRGGGISKDELHSPYNIPGRWFGEGSRRLESVDPKWGSSTVGNRPWWDCNPPGIRPTPFIGRQY